MKQSRGSLLVTAIFFLLAVGGCRTYGSHGNEEKLLSQISIANQAFADDLTLAQGLLQGMQAAGVTQGIPDSPGQQLQLLMQVHESTLENHRELAEMAAHEAGNHRFLKRAFGAIVSEQQGIRNHYNELLAPWSGSRPATTGVGDSEVNNSLYRLVPPFYLQLQARQGMPAVPVGARARADSSAVQAPVDSMVTSASTVAR